jgi:emp24/gp25L/p24 family/GOLD
MELTFYLGYFMLICVICMSSVDSLMFMLSANQRKCLKEEIHKDVLVTGDYELSDAPGQTTSLKVSQLFKYLSNFILALCCRTPGFECWCC